MNWICDVIMVVNDGDDYECDDSGDNDADSELIVMVMMVAIMMVVMMMKAMMVIEIIVMV